MAETPNIHWDREGHAHTNALHWEGFPHLLWESLQIFGYDAPPLYDGHEFVEAGVPRCRVKMTIPQHPSRYLWQPPGTTEFSPGRHFQRIGQHGHHSGGLYLSSSG
jgi:hypothetical protein